MIKTTNLCLMVGGKMLIDDADFIMHPGQHFGLSGVNGCGKSTFLKLLQRELLPDAGDLSIPATLRIVHMKQEIHELDRPAVEYVMDGDTSFRKAEEAILKAESDQDYDKLGELYSEFQDLGGYTARSRAEQLLAGLGFSDEKMQTNIRIFSGGWRVRANLAQTLMCPSDMLLLDEPTNHLDMDAIIWLEGWLNAYIGMLLIVSHDREFLDNVVDYIAHIEHEKLTTYKGNYTAFEKKRAENLILQQSHHEKQEKIKEHLESFIRRFQYKATKAKQAQSRIKALNKMAEIAPAHSKSPFTFNIMEPDRLSDPLLVIQNAEIGYHGNPPIFEKVNMTIHPGDCISFLGPNGAGKSTIIKALAGEISLLSGERVEGEHLRIGYFAQHKRESLDMDASPLTHIQRLSKTAKEQEIRDFLGRFGFMGNKALTIVDGFSGGEQSRLSLAILIWLKPNLLLLDEPTNHLDLEMRHALTMALQGFAGAIIIISHDRSLLKNTASEFYLASDGQLLPFSEDLDGYAQWLLQKKRDEKSAQQANNKLSKGKSVTEKNKKQIDKKLKLLNQQIVSLEKRLKILHKDRDNLVLILQDVDLYEPNNCDVLLGHQEKHKVINIEIEQSESMWLELHENLDILQKGELP